MITRPKRYRGTGNVPLMQYLVIAFANEEIDRNVLVNLGYQISNKGTSWWKLYQTRNEANAEIERLEYNDINHLHPRLVPSRQPAFHEKTVREVASRGPLPSPLGSTLQIKKLDDRSGGRRTYDQLSTVSKKDA